MRPVAGVVLTDWGSAWGCELIVVPGVSTVPVPTLWRRAVEAIDALGIESVEVLLDNDDAELVDLLASAGFVVGAEDGTTWMDVEERPDVSPLPEGFFLVDRAAETTNHTRCAIETADRSRPVSANARCPTRPWTSPLKRPTVGSAGTRSLGSIP